MALSAHAAAPVATDDTATSPGKREHGRQCPDKRHRRRRRHTDDYRRQLFGGGHVTFSTSSLSYEPPSDFSGQTDLTETVTYTISDGNAGTDTGTLTITVTAVNDAPVAVDDTETLTEDDPLTTITVLDDDTDADGDSLTVSAISYSGTGTAAINADNARIDYTPAANFNGTDTITYTVSDGTATDTGTLTIIVSAVNDAPVAVDDTQTLTEGDPLTNITVLDDDTDADGDTLSVSAISYSGTGKRQQLTVAPPLTTHRPQISQAQTPSPTPCLTAPPQTPGH